MDLLLIACLSAALGAVAYLLDDWRGMAVAVVIVLALSIVV